MASIYSKLFLLTTLFFGAIHTNGQVDSIHLDQDELGLEDIRITADEIARNQVFTASRTLNNVDEIPLSIYVVTGEEILRNGYFTLTDVLKSVPGIFVSQPGSAIEGETFMMNGLHGNTHAKILVNNIPVKSANVLSMPIGAQLPIRQAERIEITYGPSGIVHGIESGAGVINIITRTSERPVYTHADLGVGSQGYSSVNVLFGGKLGKNKKILKFNAYGSSTESNTINLLEFGVFSAANYPLNSFIEKPPDNSTLNVFPHTSRQVGLNLNYRSFNFSFATMSRRDHAALGSNPLSIDNQNPQTTFGERISTYNLAYKKDFKKFGLKSSLYVVDYEIDIESSFLYDQPHLKQLYNFASAVSAGNDIELRDEFIADIDSMFFSGRRYVTGREITSKLEQTVSIFPLKNLEVLVGANLELVSGNPYKEYLRRSKKNFEGGGGINRNVFVQAYLTLNRLNLIMGINRYINETSFINTQSVTSPRFAGLFKITSKLKAQASYASSFMAPSIYLLNKSGAIIAANGQQPRPASSLSGEGPFFKTQETTYGDVGLRYELNKKIRFNFTAFYAKNSNLVAYQHQVFRNEDGLGIEYGYANGDGRESELFGIRTSAIFKNIIPSREMDINVHFSYFNGEQDLPSGEKFPHIVSQPEFIAQMNFSFRLYKRLFMTFENSYIGPYASRGLETLDQYYFLKGPKYVRLERLFMDISFNLSLNNNFKMFMKMNNLFGEENTGIDATGSPDDLFYNLQRNRYFQGGVSYTIN